MSYPTGEALILTLVQSVTGFSASNAVRGRWDVLNTGSADVYAIVRPGPFLQVGASGRVEVTWTTVIEIWQLYTLDGTTLTNLESNMEAVKAKFDQYSHLNDSTGAVDFAEVTGGADVNMIPPPPNGPQWLEWDLLIRWQERQAVTFAD